VPLIDIHVIKGSCTPEQKRALLDGASKLVGDTLGEPVVRLTWVRIVETGEDDWMIGGEVFTLDHVKRLRAGELT
jgi:4-oxalocrotonate tautomerase family enzyme